MFNTVETIKTIVYEEFHKLVENIEKDFASNFARKRYNFLLSQLKMIYRTFATLWRAM